MEYRTLGSTSLKVSAIALGTMTWGEQNTFAEAAAQMDMAWEAGVNFFDVAEMYPVPPRAQTCGLSEQMLGQWQAAKGVRDQLIIATKVTGRSASNSGVGHIRNGARLSKEHINAALEGSLQRLQTDYIDLYQVHWPERNTNFFGQLGYRHAADDGIAIEETLAALEALVHSGKVRYIGISNETPWGISEYLRLHRQDGRPKVQSIQNPYNLINRSFEVGCAEMAIREKVGLLAYSPLAFGTLSGKYRNGSKPEGARLTLFDRFQRYNNLHCEEAIAEYCAIAEQAGLTPAQMALAFVNAQPFVTSNIIGATNANQLQDNIESINLKLPVDVLEKIEAVHRRYPNPAP